MLTRLCHPSKNMLDATRFCQFTTHNVCCNTYIQIMYYNRGKIVPQFNVLLFIAACKFFPSNFLLSLTLCPLSLAYKNHTFRIMTRVRVSLKISERALDSVLVEFNFVAGETVERAGRMLKFPSCSVIKYWELFPSGETFNKRFLGREEFLRYSNREQFKLLILFWFENDKNR